MNKESGAFCGVQFELDGADVTCRDLQGRELALFEGVALDAFRGVFARITLINGQMCAQPLGATNYPAALVEAEAASRQLGFGWD